MIYLKIYFEFLYTYLKNPFLHYETIIYNCRLIMQIGLIYVYSCKLTKH